MTKTQFLETYRALIVEAYPWAKDKEKLDRFMASVQKSLVTTANLWNIDSKQAVEAWKKIGGKGKLTYKSLRALPY